MTTPSGKLYIACGPRTFRVDAATFVEEATAIEGGDTPIHMIICDENYIWGAPEYPYNVLKKKDPTGSMPLISSHTLENAQDIRGISQDSNYLYLTTMLNVEGTQWIPRVLRVSKADWSESYIDLTVTGSYAGTVAGCIVDDTTLWVGGNNFLTEHSGSEIGSSILWKIDLVTFTQTGFYKYDPYPTNRGYEDFKLFTEVDPSTRISIPTHNYLDFVASTSEDARVYRDYGEFLGGHYFHDPSHKLKVTLDSADEIAGAVVYPWFLSNDLEDEEWLLANNKTAIGIWTYCVNSVDIIFAIEELYNGTRYFSDAIYGSVGTTYYFKVMKKYSPTNTVYLEVFSSQALLDASGGKMGGIGTGDVGSLSLTLQADHRFHYLMVGQTRNDGTGKLCSARIEDITFEQLENPLNINTVTYDASYVYCFTKTGLCLKVPKNLSSSSVIQVIPSGRDSGLVGAGGGGDGTIHTPLQVPYFEKTNWNDIYWITACGMKHILKIRAGVWGIERHLSEPDGDWTLISCAIGSGDYLYIGASNKRSLKKINLTGDLAVLSTLNLSVAGSTTKSLYAT